MVTQSLLAIVPLAAAALCGILLALLLPWLRRHTLAQPGDRSMHRRPTPQGGGVGVVLATFVVAWSAAGLSGWLQAETAWPLAALTAAAALLTLMGLVDDVRGLAPWPRLLIQAVATTVVITALPAAFRVMPELPLWLERAGLAVLTVWFVNLVNFMDGADWMTVAETVPITAAISVLGLFSVIPPLATLVALALLGATLGFAPFNRPVARLFLGDAGSHAIGLILAWLLLLVAFGGAVAAAVLLPLYYLADATITLAQRIRRRDNLLQAHRTHFYQRAVTGGMTVPAVIKRVFAVNALLAALAMISALAPGLALSLVCVGCGAAMVGYLLIRFAAVGPH